MKLLLLHGAIGAASQFAAIGQILGKEYAIHTLDFSGHSSTPIDNEPFSIALFAADVLRYMDNENIDKVSVLGYSMGGYVAMYLAKHHPERIGKILTLATKYEWSEAIAAKEIKMLDADKIAQKLPQFADTLAQRHTATGWKEVLRKTADMMVAMGADSPLKNNDYAQIPHKVLVALGDSDKMVGLKETLFAYQSLPNAQLCILPDTAHPIEQLDVELMGVVARRFFKE